MSKISIFLADDHQILRQGLRALLESVPEFVVVGECGDGLETVKQVLKLAPQVLVADLMMPSLNGLEVIQQVRKGCSSIRVVILSMYSNEAYLINALKNGADSYVLKESTATDLITAIKEAAVGRRFLSQPLSHLLAEAYLDKTKGTTLRPYDTLTPRDREVLQLAAEGHNNPEIGKRLSVSPRTVEVQRQNLMRKLGLRTRTDLVRFAIQEGIIPVETKPLDV